MDVLLTKELDNGIDNPIRLSKKEGIEQGLSTSVSENPYWEEHFWSNVGIEHQERPNPLTEASTDPGHQTTWIYTNTGAIYYIFCATATEIQEPPMNVALRWR